ncbi:hypothetical protein BS47DRAFT_1399191 [Hydnum rufescens UP504]|uniref:Uncharacterized protein n=1 Tax=Hydnum rufescens UP504 TaxID=1448309 RepID=A0A9P6DPX6_9AGAM|nr:hypothetical protein BS47DRAFT_1399191 [Hydnum rufescens UP504]
MDLGLTGWSATTTRTREGTTASPSPSSAAPTPNSSSTPAMGGPQGHITSRSLPASLFKINGDRPEIAKQLGEVMPTALLTRLSIGWHTLPLHECAKSYAELAITPIIHYAEHAGYSMDGATMAGVSKDWISTGRFPDETPTSFLCVKFKQDEFLCLPAQMIPTMTPGGHGDHG